MLQKILVLAIFILAYLFIIKYYEKKHLIIWVFVFALLASTILPPVTGLLAINWNVILLYFGMLFVSEVFLFSKMPDFLAVFFASKTSRIGMAMLVICALTGFLSILLENVATVLLVAPIALSIAKKCRVNAVPLFIGMAISSNLQGAATLIGDPPSMILGGFKQMNFNDFFFISGRPGMFFAVQAGAIVSLFVLYFFFRKMNGKMPDLKKESYISLVPTIFVILLIVALVFTSFFEEVMPFSAGAWCIIFGLIAYIWYVNHVRGNKIHIRAAAILLVFFIIGTLGSGVINEKIFPLTFDLIWVLVAACTLLLLIRRKKDPLSGFLGSMDWHTGLFLIGIFILVESLSSAGIISDIAGWMMKIAGANLLFAYLIIVWFSVLLSSFIDNVPYLVIMLPVAQALTDQLGANPYILFFGLLLGASIGGNITPIGASANIVAMGMARKHGYSVSFMQFVKMGLPFTLVSMIVSTWFIWLVFS